MPHGSCWLGPGLMWKRLACWSLGHKITSRGHIASIMVAGLPLHEHHGSDWCWTACTCPGTLSASCSSTSACACVVWTARKSVSRDDIMWGRLIGVMIVRVTDTIWVRTLPLRLFLIPVCSPCYFGRHVGATSSGTARTRPDSSLAGWPWQTTTHSPAPPHCHSPLFCCLPGLFG